MNSKSTLHSAAFDYISTITCIYLTFLIFYLEKSGILSLAFEESPQIDFETALECFEYLYEHDYEGKFNPPTASRRPQTEQEAFSMRSYQTYKFSLPGVYDFFPFTEHIHQMMMSLETLQESNSRE